MKGKGPGQARGGAVDRVRGTAPTPPPFGAVGVGSTVRVLRTHGTGMGWDPRRRDSRTRRPCALWQRSAGGEGAGTEEAHELLRGHLPPGLLWKTRKPDGELAPPSPGGIRPQQRSPLAHGPLGGRDGGGGTLAGQRRGRAIGGGPAHGKGAPKTSGGFPKEEMPRLEVKKPSAMDWVVYKK